MSNRFSRQILLFGELGQRQLASCRVAVVGIGGLGTHVVQQLALLGVGELVLIDSQELDETNRNRYVGVRHDDPTPGTLKVDIGERIAHEIDPSIQVTKVPTTLVSKSAFAAIRGADYVFGCLDREGARLILNELCAAYTKPYVDLASEILPGEPPQYGGRVCISWNGSGCLYCYDELDKEEAQRDLEGPVELKQRHELYGVTMEALERTGPSVVSINGVVASIGVTEFMLAVTGIREPKGLCTYRGNVAKVTVPGLDGGLPHDDCYYCEFVRGKGPAADVERYLRAKVGEYLR